MSIDSRPVNDPPMSRSGLIIALYSALALTAILISAGRDDVDIYRIEGTSTATRLFLSPLIGLGVAVIVIIGSRLLVKRYAWGRQLHQDFRNLLGPLSTREIFILAVASSVGEELLFRGALQPWIGLWPQALVFALLHVGPGSRFLPWTISALVMGVAFGYMAVWTGDLGGPIVAHFTINFVNLRFIARTDFAPARAPTPRPAATTPAGGTETSAAESDQAA
jgi:membrane protease YdiL (CAAX protease family)